MNRNFIVNSNYLLRKILNNENQIDIIKDMIESILSIKIDSISLNPYLTKKQKYLPKEENFGIVDVRILTTENEEMNVGIQFIDGKYIQTKMLMYYSQIHLNQIEYEDNREFAKTVTINILDFSYYKTSSYLKKLILKSKEEGTIQTQEMEMYVIELPKFLMLRNNLNKKEQWILYLKGCDNDMLNMLRKENEYIAKLDDLINIYWNEEYMY